MLNGKMYIGQTIRSLAQRWSQHCRDPRNKALSNAIRKYGKEAFSKDILAEYNSLEDLNNAEEYYISWYNCLAPNGYNVAYGGDNHLRSEETKKRIGLGNKGKPNYFKGKKRGPFTEEHKLKLRAARKPYSESIKGKKRDPEIGKKISASRMGIKQPNQFKGKTHSEESRKNMREGRRKAKELRELAKLENK